MQVGLLFFVDQFFWLISLFLTFVFPVQCCDTLFQISDFGSAKADFGTDLAISTRSELNPGDNIRMLKISRVCERVV